MNLLYVHCQSDTTCTNAASRAKLLEISCKVKENKQWSRLPLCLVRGTGVVSSNLSFRTRCISLFISMSSVGMTPLG
jgi:hypothetical protein